jgi:hypothetical protein
MQINTEKVARQIYNATYNVDDKRHRQRQEEQIVAFLEYGDLNDLEGLDEDEMVSRLTADWQEYEAEHPYEE